MAKPDPALWDRLMEHLRDRHPEVCRKWFEQMRLIELDGGLLLIATPNEVHRNYLQTHGREAFTEAAQHATGALVGVRFVTQDEAAKVVRPPAARPAGVRNGRGPERRLAGVPADRREGTRTGATTADGQPITLDQTLLSPDFAFDNFVTGPNNQLAYAAARAVAQAPGTAYNPLFIHGGVGLGKTHLLQATCQHILTDNPDTRIVYVSCEAFMNQFIACVQHNQMHEFRHHYRDVDVLVIDDIHFIGNRERSQEEFFHTFNELHQSQRQIVLSSDAPPADIPHLEDRLRSRFQSGLVAMVTEPTFETRVAILQAKASLRQIEVTADVLEYLARKVDSNARELEGAITTLQAHANLQGQPINLDLARAAMGDRNGDGRLRPITLQHITDAVTNFYSVKISDLQSRRRHKSITEPRQVCMWLARKRTRISLEEIGGHFGGRDHTTVMHAIDVVNQRMEANPQFAREVNHLDSELQTADAAN